MSLKLSPQRNLQACSGLVYCRETVVCTITVTSFFCTVFPFALLDEKHDVAFVEEI